MNISYSPIRSLHCLNPATITSVLFAVSVRTLTFTPPKQFPPPSYTPSLTTVTLFTTVFRNIKWIVSNTSRILLLKLLSRLQNSNTSLLFWNLFTGLKFPNELNIKLPLSLTKFSIPLSLRIYMTLYLFSLLAVTTHALHLMSLSSNQSINHKILTCPFLN